MLLLVLVSVSVPVLVLVVPMTRLLEATEELPSAGASGAAEATPPKAKQAAGALEAAETAAEVRPASRNEAFSHEPETAPEAHLAELAQPELQQQHVELKVLVDAFDRISATTKRLEMTGGCARLCRKHGAQSFACPCKSGYRPGLQSRWLLMQVWLQAWVAVSLAAHASLATGLGCSLSGDVEVHASLGSK